jgi:hypothetical protein
MIKCGQSLDSGWISQHAPGQVLEIRIIDTLCKFSRAYDCWLVFCFQNLQKMKGDKHVEQERKRNPEV